ncbi:MAG: galactose-1-phosphate uridylyltransferase [Calditrichia bacterium]
MSELRKDPIIDRWVIISTERGKRPTDFQPVRKKSNIKFCPFCPGNEDKTPPAITQVPDEAGNWKIRVVPNKYPALRVEGELNRRGIGVYDMMEGIGAHEIVIETPEHDKDLVDLDYNHIRNIFQIFKQRINDLKNDQRLKYVMVFKNHGNEAGASLEHSHSQLIATPVVPKRVHEELQGAKRYYEFKERCIFCDLIYQEIKEEERVVLNDEHFLAIAPFASRFPFETWILPKNHRSNYEQTGDEYFIHLASVVKNLISRLNKALNAPAYNFLIHTGPLRENTGEYYHWHIEIIPKLTLVAGFEWGTGFYINPTSPEDAAEYLKNLK